MRLILFLLLVIGCVKENRPAENTFTSDLANLKNQVDALESRLDEHDSKLLDFSSTILTSDSEGFGRMDSTLAPFWVSIKNVRPYADGFKVTLNLGNPSYATFSAPKVTINWGPRFDSKKIKYSEWRNAIRSTSVTVQGNLRPGSWNPATFVLAPATKDDLGRLEISIETPTVALSNH